MELEFIQWLSQHLPPPTRTLGGIGDDAALLEGDAAGQLVVTTDAVTDEIDFRRDEASLQQIGHKALGVNLSDLAAMAAEPLVAVVSLVLPRDEALSTAIGLYEGMLPLADRYGLELAGGDTNVWSHPLAISITALGRTTAAGPLRRSGALPGDRVLVTGTLGGSLLGRHLAVEPRVDEALLLNSRYRLHAGLDISDGLALDAARLADASHCGLVLDLQNIPISAAARTIAKTSRNRPVDHALGDGEDFELLLTAPADVAAEITDQQPLEIPITDIGVVVAEPGLFQQTGPGDYAPLEPRGWRH